MCFRNRSPDPSVFPHHSHFPQPPYRHHCSPILLPPGRHSTQDGAYHSSPALTRGREGTRSPAPPPCSPPCTQGPPDTACFTTPSTSLFASGHNCCPTSPRAPCSLCGSVSPHTTQEAPAGCRSHFPTAPRSQAKPSRPTLASGHLRAPRAHTPSARAGSASRRCWPLLLPAAPGTARSLLQLSSLWVQLLGVVVKEVMTPGEVTGQQTLIPVPPPLPQALFAGTNLSHVPSPQCVPAPPQGHHSQLRRQRGPDPRPALPDVPHLREPSVTCLQHG